MEAILPNKDYEYCKNRGITVESQISYQNGLPFVKPMPSFYGVVGEYEGAGQLVFDVQCNSLYLDLERLTKGTTFRLKLFYTPEEAKDATFSILNFKDFNDTRILFKRNIIPKSNVWHTIEVVGPQELKIIDWEEEPMNPVYYSYYTVDKCIDSIINYFEENLKYKIISRTELIEADKNITDIDKKEQDILLKLEVLKSNELVRNVKEYRKMVPLIDPTLPKEEQPEIELNKNGLPELLYITCEIGFDPLNFPEDLKTGLKDGASYLYHTRGDLIKTSNYISTYGSNFLSDTAKSILWEYQLKSLEFFREQKKKIEQLTTNSNNCCC